MFNLHRNHTISKKREKKEDVAPHVPIRVMIQTHDIALGHDPVLLGQLRLGERLPCARARLVSEPIPRAPPTKDHQRENMHGAFRQEREEERRKRRDRGCLVACVPFHRTRRRSSCPPACSATRSSGPGRHPWTSSRGRREAWWWTGEFDGWGIECVGEMPAGLFFLFLSLRVIEASN